MVMPNKDEMMRRKELQEEDLLRCLPAGIPELVKQLGVSDRKVQSMLVSLRRRGVINFREGKWRIKIWINRLPHTCNRTGASDE